MTQQRVSPVSITSVLPATVTLSVQGALGQSANLQEWKTSTGSNLATITSTGQVFTPQTFARYFTNRTNSGAYFDSELVSNSFVLDQRTTTAVNLIIRGAASQTANLQEWQGSDGVPVARMTSIGTALFGTNAGLGAVVGISTIQTTFKGLVIRSVTSQTANTFEIQNSAGTVLTSITAAGTINFASGNTSATANTGAVALPALAVGFITMQIAGTTVKVPYYNN